MEDKTIPVSDISEIANARVKKRRAGRGILITALVPALIIGLVLAFWDTGTALIRQSYTDGAIEAVDEALQSGGGNVTVTYEIPDTALLRVSGEDEETTTVGDIVGDITQYDASNSTLTLLGVIEIPTVDVFEPVYAECNNLALRYGCAHYSASKDLLATDGNCSIMGHRFYEGNYAFTDLVLVEEGDYVYVTTTDGRIKTYAVEETLYTTPEDLPGYLDGDRYRSEHLTLTTCARENGEAWRFVVVCTPAKSTESEDDGSGLYRAEEGVVTRIERHEAAGRGETNLMSYFGSFFNFELVPIILIGLILVIILAIIARKLYKKHH